MLRTLHTLLAALVLTLAPVLAHAQDSAATAPAATPAETATASTPAPINTGDTIAREAIVIDYDTGTVLLDKNADQRMPTSSMSKTMTIYMAFEALKNGKLSLDQKLPVSEKAWRMQGSKMFVEVGSAIAVEDLIRGIIIQSGNDATIVLAEGISGTEEGFADMMNAKAREIGMDSSHFVNASGWPDPEHYSTARDLATLAVHTIRDFPDFYKYYAEKEFTWHNIHQMNRNLGSGAMDGRRVVLVVNGLADEKERAQESARLLEWGLRNFENAKLFTAGDTVEQAYVAMGESEQIPLVVNEDIVVTVPKAVRNDLKVTALYETPLIAPVKKGDQVGTLRVDIPRVGVREYPLMAGQDVEKLGLIAGTLTKAKMMLGAKHPE
ncbi:MAG: D-alanyl-D-alanine carboxypeptidase [Micavibrio aeruginosavorus]|nr:D-alanyl-D-alanine carboxypeptidase [Micavibrio aeruginosavorus]